MKNVLHRWVINGLGDMEEVSYTGISTGVRDSAAGGDPTEGGSPGEDSTAAIALVWDK